MKPEYLTTLESAQVAASEARYAELLEAARPFMNLGGLYSALPDEYLIYDFASGTQLFRLGDLRRIARVALLQKSAATP